MTWLYRVLCFPCLVSLGSPSWNEITIWFILCLDLAQSAMSFWFLVFCKDDEDNDNDSDGNDML
jgi:hypothetical protein